MKTETFKFHAESIGASMNSRGDLVVVAHVNQEKFLDKIAQKFFLKDLFYASSMQIGEVMDQVQEHFGNDEVHEYINGLGER